MALTFTLIGHPPSPNASVRRLKTWRESACAAAVQALRDAGNADDYPLDAAIVRLVCVVPDRRRRDPDNFTAACKGAIDGAVDAGVLRDDSFGVIRRLEVVSEAGPAKAIRMEVTTA
ncbi:MAG: hypothetical protein WAN48_10775 [Actinomycetes bacterium]